MTLQQKLREILDWMWNRKQDPEQTFEHILQALRECVPEGKNVADEWFSGYNSCRKQILDKLGE